jgi:hypothetical protein
MLDGRLLGRCDAITRAAALQDLSIFMSGGGLSLFISPCLESCRRLPSRDRERFLPPQERIEQIGRASPTPSWPPPLPPLTPSIPTTTPRWAGGAARSNGLVDPEQPPRRTGTGTEWKAKLAALADAQAEFARRRTRRLRTISAFERTGLIALGSDIAIVWSAPTTTDRDRKEPLRTLLDEVRIDLQRELRRADLMLRWRGGATTQLAVELRARNRKSALTRMPST